MSKPRNRRPKLNQPKPQAPENPTTAAPGDVTSITEPSEPVRLVIAQDVQQLETHDVDERQLTLLMKDWRKGRATRNLWQMLGDAYVAVISVLIISAMLVGAIIRAQNVAASCTTDGCQSARGLLPWAALAGVLALTLAAARMFGPVLASAAEGFWLMEAPLRRAKLLGGRLVSAIALALVGGAAIGALVASLTGSSGRAVVAWAFATGLGAAGLTAMAAAEQGAERTWLVKGLQGLVSLAGLAALLLVVATSAGWVHWKFTDSLAVELASIVAGVGLLMLVVAGFIARARLGNIRRARLTSGGSLVAGMQGAAYALDLGLMRDILVERQAVERGHVNPTRGRGVGLRALVMRDVQRLYRFPRQLVLLVASVVVPYAVQALGLGRLVVPIAALVLMGALIPTFSTLRVLSRTKGLARTLPFSTSELRTAATVVPAVLALVWAVLAVPGFLGAGGGGMIGKSPMEAAMWSVITGFIGLLAAMRWVSAKSADYSAPMVATNLGAMPPGLMFNLVRGFDIVALVSLPAIVGWSPWVSIILGLLVFGLLRMGTLDAEELRAMQEENQRKLKEAQEQARRDDPRQKKAAAAPAPRPAQNRPAQNRPAQNRSGNQKIKVTRKK